MNLAPEDAIEEMASKYVKHDKDQFPHARTPHVRNHHVRQEGGVPMGKNFKKWKTTKIVFLQ